MAPEQHRLSLEQVQNTLEGLAHVHAMSYAIQIEFSELEEMLKNTTGHIHTYLQGRMGELTYKLNQFRAGLQSYALNFAEAPINTVIDVLNKTYGLGAQGYQRLTMKLGTSQELLRTIVGNLIPEMIRARQAAAPAREGVLNTLERLIQSNAPQGQPAPRPA